jgi:hypothetical protein
MANSQSGSLENDNGGDQVAPPSKLATFQSLKERIEGDDLDFKLTQYRLESNEPEIGLH